MLTEEEQMARAIQMSMGNDGGAASSSSVRYHP